MKQHLSLNLRRAAFVVTALAASGGAYASPPMDIFEVSGAMMGGPQFASYSFEITDTSLGYQASLLDYAFPASFDFLSMAITRGATLLGTVTGSGSFSFFAAGAGTYTALVFGDPGGSYGAGSYGISVTGAVPEPQAWGMFAAGLGMVGLVAYRRNRKALLLTDRR